MWFLLQKRGKKYIRAGTNLPYLVSCPTPIHRSFIKFHYGWNVNSHWSGFPARIWKLIHWKMFLVYIKWTPHSLAMRELIWDYDTDKFRNRIKNSAWSFISRSFTDTFSKSCGISSQLNSIVGYSLLSIQSIKILKIYIKGN